MCVEDVHDARDYCYWGIRSELLYECQGCGYDVFNLRFCNLCWSGCQNLTYCDHCFACKDCFGCSGLKKKQYCIFNKQYTKEEYEVLVSRIIEHMKKTEEYGEFFPISDSTFAYNESLAQEHLPITKEDALRLDYPWKDKGNKDFVPQGNALPDDITEATDEYTSKVFSCASTQKNFKIIPQELEFYRKHNIPLPIYHPDERHQRRFSQRNPRRLHARQCQKCNKEIKTTFAPETPEIVYCEACYLDEVY